MITKKDVQAPEIVFKPEAPLPAPKVPWEKVELLPSRPRVAVLTVHGMGQQIPFQTLDAMAEGLAEEDKRRRSSPGSAAEPPEATARNVMLGTQLLQRVELELTGANGEAVEAHLYEAYWAPMTEGQVKLHDVFAFLWRGFLHGLRNCFSPFYRWMFDTPVDFGTQASRTIAILLAGLFLATLVFLNGLIAAVAAARLRPGKPDAWPSDVLLSDLTQLVGLFVLLLVVIGILIVVALWLKHHGSGMGRRPVSAVINALLIGFCVLTVVLAAPFGVLLICVLVKGHTWSWLSRLLPFKEGMGPAATLFAWAILLAASAVIRWFFIEFAGDVAVYVSPHVLDRFAELRQKIKDFVCGTAKAIYDEKDASGRHLYDAVAVVGHSLGSVIAYDIVNRLLIDDALSNASRDVLKRTRILLTFGSPLDKAAFIFGIHGTETGTTREVLAAKVQPLIDNRAFRMFPWVNIHSNRDIFSNALTFYDEMPEPSGTPVTNLEDPDARIPIAAHIEYWQNPKLFSELHRAVAQ